MKGQLFLIPTFLDASNDQKFISPAVSEVIKNTSHYLVENVRTARRFISSLNMGLDISSLYFEQLDKRTSPADLDQLCRPLLQNLDVGVMSEAGLPGLADPGNLAVAWAHKNHVRVVPLPGASSIQMALIASGFNGQQFTFHGYLPIDKEARKKKINELEMTLTKTGYTQVFMETPFRNSQLFETLVLQLHGDTLLSIAAGLSGDHEFIQTKSIRDWKKLPPELHKIPAVFSLGVFTK